MNSIPEEQNTEHQLDRLAAQRQLYSSAKMIQGLQMVLAVVGGSVLSLVTIARPEWKAYGGLYGVGVAFFDQFFMVPRQKALKQQAATVQELFDCEVLQLPWRDLKAGHRPDAELIMSSSANITRKDPDRTTLRNWYPVDVAKLPIHLARLVCQRCSCRWDAELRRRYGMSALASASFLVVVLFFIGIVKHLTVDALFIGVIAPLLPMLAWGIREYRENTETATAAEKLKVSAEKTWEKGVGGAAAEELTQEARNIQDEIFDIRRRSSLVYDWFYRRLSGSQERQMIAGAEEYIQQALRAEAPSQLPDTTTPP